MTYEWYFRNNLYMQRQPEPSSQSTIIHLGLDYEKIAKGLSHGRSGLCDCKKTEPKPQPEFVWLGGITK